MFSCWLLFLIVPFALLSIANAGGFESSGNNGELPAEALYLEKARKEFKTGFAGFPERPGSATRTHSCNHIRGLPSELRSSQHMRPDGLTNFYQKYTEAYGIPVVSSANVPDDALKRACYTVRFLLADSAVMRQSFYKMAGRVAIIGKDEKTNQIPEHSWLEDWWNTRARGLGATTYHPISTCAEENVLCMHNDRWYGDDIALHEYLHALHALSANQVMQGFEQRIIGLYKQHKNDPNSVWTNTYAMSTDFEYFAETAQSYLNSHIHVDPPNGVHNHISDRARLKIHDRTMHDIFQNEIFLCHNEYLIPCDPSLSASQLREREHNQVLKMDCDGSTVPTESTGGRSCSNSAQYDANCDAWASAGYCTKDEWSLFMGDHCRRSCNHADCNRSTTAITTAPTESTGGRSCSNSAQYDANCDAWASAGYCTKEESSLFMGDHCRRSCNHADCTRSTAPTESTGGSTCSNSEEFDKQCDAWAARGYCTRTQLSIFMKEHCRKSCNHGDCTGGTSPTESTTESTCSNTAQYDKECDTWAAAGYCTGREWSKFMGNNCRKSCNHGDCIAGTSPTESTTGSTCSNTAQYDALCDTWVSAGYCTGSEWSEFMGKYCRKSCNYPDCNGSTVPTESTGERKCSNSAEHDAQCDYWASTGFCTRQEWSKFMRNNCSKSCNYSNC